MNDKTNELSEIKLIIAVILTFILYMTTGLILNYYFNLVNLNNMNQHSANPPLELMILFWIGSMVYILPLGIYFFIKYRGKK